MNVLDRFWSKVDKTDGCWIWMAGGDRYGCFTPYRGSKQLLVHRFSYEMAYGLIPEGMQIDHLCGEPKCVRPDHLETVTPAENSRRSSNASALNARKTHCIHGHEFTPANTYLRKLPSGALGRQCRRCNINQAWLTKPAEKRRPNQYTNQTTCKWGHPFDGVSGQQRTCSVCQRRNREAYRQRQQATQNAGLVREYL